MRGVWARAGLPGIALLLCVSARGEEIISFNQLAPGMVVDQVFANSGAGPVLVTAVNPLFQPGTNAAVVFDAANPTGGDADLGSPNQTCAIPGPGVGWSGVATSAFSNCTPRGKVLIVAENLVDVNPPDGLVDDPDDSCCGGTLTFDFSKFGAVTASTITVFDVEPAGTIELFGVAGAPLGAPIRMPSVGDNGVKEVRLGNVPGVVKIQVNLPEAGAVDDIVFRLESDRGTEGCTVGFWESTVTQTDPARNNNGVGFWEASGMLPTDSYNATFGVDVRPDRTLLQTLALTYTGAGALARESVAALLNALQPQVRYPLSAAEVVAMVQQAKTPEDELHTAALLHDFNDQPNGQQGFGCPLIETPQVSIHPKLPRRRLRGGRR